MKNSLILALFSACLSSILVTEAHARACFVVGGQCTDNTYYDEYSGVHAENCVSLGYSYNRSNCVSPKVLTEPSCNSNGTTWYKECKCPQDVYKYTSDNITENQELVGDTCDGKYAHYRCKTSYNGISFSYVSSQADVSAIQSLGFGVGNVGLCPTNSTVDTSTNDLEDKCTEENHHVRYSQCTCNTDLYKYEKSLANYDANVFDMMNMCKGSDGNEYYKDVECTGNSDGLYTYRHQCGDGERSDGSIILGNTADAAAGRSYTCYKCISDCSGITESECRAELAIAGNRGKHCKKQENCETYILEAGGVCPCGVAASDVTTTDPGNIFSYSTVTNAGGTCYWNIEEIDPCRDVNAADATTTKPGNLQSYDSVTNAYGTCYYNIKCGFSDGRNWIDYDYNEYEGDYNHRILILDPDVNPYDYAPSGVYDIYQPGSYVMLQSMEPGETVLLPDGSSGEEYSNLSGNCLAIKYITNSYYNIGLGLVYYKRSEGKWRIIPPLNEMVSIAEEMEENGYELIGYEIADSIVADQDGSESYSVKVSALDSVKLKSSLTSNYNLRSYFDQTSGKWNIYDMVNADPVIHVTHSFGLTWKIPEGGHTSWMSNACNLIEKNVIEGASNYFNDPRCTDQTCSNDYDNCFLGYEEGNGGVKVQTGYTIGSSYSAYYKKETLYGLIDDDLISIRPVTILTGSRQR